MVLPSLKDKKCSAQANPGANGTIATFNVGGEMEQVASIYNKDTLIPHSALPLTERGYSVFLQETGQTMIMTSSKAFTTQAKVLPLNAKGSGLVLEPLASSTFGTGSVLTRSAFPEPPQSLDHDKYTGR